MFYFQNDKLVLVFFFFWW